MGRGVLAGFLLPGTFAPAAKLPFGQSPAHLSNPPLVPSPVVPGATRFDLGLPDFFLLLFLLMHGSAFLLLHRLPDEERFFGFTYGQYGTLVSVLPELLAPDVAFLTTRRRTAQ